MEVAHAISRVMLKTNNSIGRILENNPALSDELQKLLLEMVNDAETNYKNLGEVIELIGVRQSIWGKEGMEKTFAVEFEWRDEDEDEEDVA